MRVLCIGDSNTWGFNPETKLRFKNRWTKVLETLLPEDEIIEEGLSGRTVISIDPKNPWLCGINSLRCILETHQPVDLVILMIGSNEHKNIFNSGANFIAGGIDEFIKIIKNPFTCEKYPVPELLVISPVELKEKLIEVEGEGGIFDENSIKNSKLLPRALEELCKRRNIFFMKASDFAEASSIDGIHMTEENHFKLAHGIKNKIIEIKETI